MTIVTNPLFSDQAAETMADGAALQAALDQRTAEVKKNLQAGNFPAALSASVHGVPELVLSKDSTLKVSKTPKGTMRHTLVTAPHHATAQQ